ncbi:MAG: tRNA 2-thiocytidine biosynthesis protein TtcA [Firmicutes bacterium]|nr:tRNA 2-thiocytidine biosynthesis protein TtcA [Bacillota bacterium]
MARVLTEAQKIEQSLTKRFRKEIWSPFLTAIREYDLIREGDKIAVCISGGKDSMCLAKLMQMLQKHSDFPFDVCYLVMDPGYAERNRRLIEENAARLDLPVEVFTSQIFDIAFHTDESPCYLCARMRRGALYAEAKKRGCNKIALGHHLNDVIETTLLGMFYASQLQGMMPKLHSQNFEGMELIRPLYKVKEESILRWKDYNQLQFLQCACRFTEQIGDSEDGIGDSKRQEIKLLIKELKKTNPDIEQSLFGSLHNVHLETFPGFRKDGKAISFLEQYDQK